MSGALAPSYRVLIIGCGNIAGGFDIGRAPDQLPLSHAGAYVRHGSFQIRACVDPDDDRRRSFARKWSVPGQAANLNDLGAVRGDFDVISICSPTSLHHEHLEQALQLGPRVIFCEKPLATDVASAEYLVQACRENGVPLVVNYSRHWDPSVAAFIGELGCGRWGKIRSVVGHYNKGILNNGGHMLELLLRTLGSMEVTAATCADFDFWDSDPTVAALLSAGGGAIPVYLSPADARDYAYFELEFVCSLGVVRMLAGGGAWEFREVVPSEHYAGYNTLGPARKVDGRYQEAMSLALQDIYRHLTTGAVVGSSGESALQVQRLCEQIRSSALVDHARASKGN